MSLSAISMMPSLRISSLPRSSFSFAESVFAFDCRAGRMILSSTLRFLSIYICWKIKPISSSRSAASSFGFSAEISLPPNRTVPAVMLSIPETVYNKVDLPEPDGPITATISPSSTEKLTLRSTLFCLLLVIYVLQRSVTSKILAMMMLLFYRIDFV